MELKRNRQKEGKEKGPPEEVRQDDQARLTESTTVGEGEAIDVS